MSDVPATAFWAVALAVAWREGIAAALVAGIAAAIAILVRPNLAPLAMVVAVMILTERSLRIRRLACFGSAVACSTIAIAALNWYWYGSPLRSGYGTLDDLYAIRRVWPNLLQYGRWLIAWQTPLVAVGLLAPVVLGRHSPDRLRILLTTVAFPLAVVGLYAPYLTFDHWLYLRFLLPAFPTALAGASAVMVRLSRSSSARRSAAMLVIFVMLYGWIRAGHEGLFQYAEHERRFSRAIAFAKALPEHAILVSVSHSGTLNLYSGRDVLRWEVLHPPQLDRIVAALRDGGHRCISWAIRSRFANSRGSSRARRRSMSSDRRR